MPDGDEFYLDVTRFDEDSTFHGDSISVEVGNPNADGFTAWTAQSPFGTVEVDGLTVRADDIAFSNAEAGTEITGAFEVSCG